MNITKLTKHELQDRLKNIKLLSLDADGTLTDGGVYIDNTGNHFRRFSAHDGIGIATIREHGVKVAIVTTSEEKAIALRAEILNVDHIIMGSFDKGKDIENLCNQLDIDLKDTIHMGDDVNDISAFVKVGFAIGLSNGVEQIRPFCCYMTENRGGHDGVREVCDIILMSKTGKHFGKPFVPDHFIRSV